VSHSHRRGAVTSGFAWISIGRLVLQAANLVSLMVTSRYLAPGEFGLFAPVAIIGSLAYAASEGTFATVLMQRQELTDDHVRVSLWASVLTALAATALMVGCSPLVERGFGFPGLAAVIAVSALMLPARLVAAVPANLLQRQMRFREIAGVSLTTSILGKTIPTVVLAVSGFGVWSLVAGYIIQAYMDAAILLRLARPSLAWPTDWHCARDVLHFGGRFMAIKSVNQIALNIDTVLVGRLLGVTSLGLYSRAFALMMLPVGLLGTTAQQALFPSFARVQHDKALLRQQFYTALDVMTGLVMPLSGILVVLTGGFVLVVLGEQWQQVVMPTRILFAAITFRIGYGLAETLSFATARLTSALIRQVVYACLIATGAWIGSRWGLSGVAAGVAIALLVFYIGSVDSAVRLVDGSRRTLVMLHLRGLAITALAVGPATALTYVGAETANGQLVIGVGSGVLFCLTMSAIVFKGPRWLSGASGEVLPRFAKGFRRKIGTRESQLAVSL
jgi:O-antigen/teichoic acid export membrane protein